MSRRRPPARQARQARTWAALEMQQAAMTLWTLISRKYKSKEVNPDKTNRGLRSRETGHYPLCG